MKPTKKTKRGRRVLKTNNLETASEWILDNIAGLRTFELQIVIRSEDLPPEDESVNVHCVHCARDVLLTEEGKKLFEARDREHSTDLRKWWPEHLR